MELNNIFKSHINQWITKFPLLFTDPLRVHEKIDRIFKSNNIQKIIVNDKDKFFKDSMAGMDKTLKEVHEVLSNESLNDEEKQKRLECINTPFSSKVKNLAFQTNPICSKAIEEIDALLHSCKDIDELYKKLMKNDKVRYKALNAEKKKR